MLIGIKIEKLFDIFDYDIEFKKEGITILTGPNGYGKTTILKILDALASQNSLFFTNLLFQKIIFEFSYNNKIILEKKNNDQVWISSTDKKGSINWNRFLLSKLFTEESIFSHFYIETHDGRWRDRSHAVYNTNELLNDLILKYPRHISELKDGELREVFNKTPDVYFISAQRLLRLDSNENKIRHLNSYISEEENDVRESSRGNVFKNTIEEYAKELCDTIKDTLAKYSQIAQELDSSFPRRLFDQKNDISENEFKQRFEKVKEIQKLLSKYGLYDIKEDNHPTYKQENSKALFVYIGDAEAKLAIFHELLEKLSIFTEILNERRFTFKKIAVSKENGFKFTTDNKLPLALGDLSSGEQQEVVLLYELLFKVKAGTLVLIDEPELSLHVVWQKQFLDDLFKIIELQKISIVVATHSPQIINNHWDLTVDLEELRDAAISK